MATPTPYDKDFHQWSLDQAKYLRTGAYNYLDTEHLIEEIESLSNSDQRAMESHFVVILLHLLKQKYQPEKKTRSWELSIKASRKKANRILSKNPSFKRFLGQWREEAYEDAIIAASVETGLEEKTFPKECPWTIDEILGQQNEHV